MQSLDADLKKGEAHQKKRGKALGAVLSTGETVDNYRTHNEITNENSV